MHSSQGDDLDALIGEPEAVRRTFDTMPLIMVEYSGAEHRIAAINAAFRRIVGRPVRITAAPLPTRPSS